jgi:CDK-activating kinase assembly factor MAT1
MDCRQPTSKRDYKDKSRLDTQAESDISIRGRVMSIYNKREEDFKSSNLFDEYIEEREEIIFNLFEKIDYEETNK